MTDEEIAAMKAELLDPVHQLAALARWPQKLSGRTAVNHGWERLIELGYATREPIADGTGDGRWAITDAGREYLRTTQGRPLL